ncbi:MAG: hypothetical protein U0573_08845 [Phycisphaerales bacterium]|nr:hypothetical protein [Planctomycetota bacterium]
METGKPQSQQGSPTAIVCRRADASGLSELREALAKRGFRVEEFGSTHEVAARALRSSNDRARTVIVLVEPRNLSRPHELIRALENVSPHLLAWVYNPSGTGEQLRAVTTDDMATWAIPAKVLPGPEKPRTSSSQGLVAGGDESATGANGTGRQTYRDRGDGTPSLRLTGAWSDTGLSPHPQENPAAGSEPTAPLLSDEELAMLLGDDPSAAGGSGN